MYDNPLGLTGMRTGYWTRDEERKLLELRATGLSWLQVARELDRSEAAVVSRYLTKLKAAPARELRASEHAPFSDAEKAKRFRAKAAEALQLADLAETESRRATLIGIANHYNRSAEQLEGLAEAKAASRK